MKLNRAYAILDVKDVSQTPDVVTIKGMASTPTPDRIGDVVDPMGAIFKTPMPLLWQHDHDKPVGKVTFAKPTKKGIPFTAELPIVKESGTLKDRIDEAIQSMKLGLVSAVSIGFGAVDGAVEYIKETGGNLFKEWHWYELSLVTIPANAEATIDLVKSLDRQHLPPTDGHQAERTTESHDTNPSGEGKPEAASRGVKALPADKGQKMNIREQITQYENTRAAKAAALAELMNKSAEAGETLNEEQGAEYAQLETEVRNIDTHLKRLATHEEIVIAKATPVTGVSDTKGGSDIRGGGSVIGLSKKLPPGIGFARLAMCIAKAQGNLYVAEQVAREQYPDMVTLQNVIKGAASRGGFAPFIKAAVPAGTTTDTTWAKPLVEYNDYVGDFLDFLRAESILDKFGRNGVPALASLPFNVHIKGQTSGGTGYWVGEGQAKPVTKFDYSDAYHGWYKVAGIAVITEELMRFSNPSAEARVRDSLRDAIVEKMDISFIDPTFAGAAGVSPASITNGVTAVTASGLTAADLRADLVTLWTPLIGAKMKASSAVYIMDSMTALRLSSMRTSLESSPEFDGLSVMGGKLDGIPVIVSDYVPVATAGGKIILVIASEVYLSDDGQVAIDASREASIQMESAPTNASGPTAAATTVVSMFQTDSVALRAERYCNWSKRRPSAVQYITSANYGS